MSTQPTLSHIRLVEEEYADYYVGRSQRLTKKARKRSQSISEGIIGKISVKRQHRAAGKLWVFLFGQFCIFISTELKTHRHTQTHTDTHTYYPF